MRLLTSTPAVAARCWVALHLHPASLAMYGVAAATAAVAGQQTVLALGPVELPTPLPAGLLIAALCAMAVALLVCHGHRQVVQDAARPVWPVRLGWFAVVLLIGYVPLLACTGSAAHLVRNYLVFTGLAVLGSVIGGSLAAAAPVAVYLLAAIVLGHGEEQGRFAVHGWALVLDAGSAGLAPAALVACGLAAASYVAVGAYLSGRLPD